MTRVFFIEVFFVFSTLNAAILALLCRADFFHFFPAQPPPDASAAALPTEIYIDKNRHCGNYVSTHTPPSNRQRFRDFFNIFDIFQIYLYH